MTGSPPPPHLMDLTPSDLLEGFLTGLAVLFLIGPSAGFLVILAWKHLYKGVPMPVFLPDDIQALLDQAVADRNEANSAADVAVDSDANLITAHTNADKLVSEAEAKALDMVSTAEENDREAKAESLQAHEKALASAHDLIQKLQDFLATKDK